MVAANAQTKISTHWSRVIRGSIEKGPTTSAGQADGGRAGASAPPPGLKDGAIQICTLRRELVITVQTSAHKTKLPSKILEARLAQRRGAGRCDAGSSQTFAHTVPTAAMPIDTSQGASSPWNSMSA
jgi:hypothetical protein